MLYLVIDGLYYSEPVLAILYSLDINQVQLKFSWSQVVLLWVYRKVIILNATIDIMLSFPSHYLVIKRKYHGIHPSILLKLIIKYFVSLIQAEYWEMSYIVLHLGTIVSWWVNYFPLHLMGRFKTRKTGCDEMNKIQSNWIADYWGIGRKSKLCKTAIFKK